jgi:hypothetical protein
MGGHEMGWIKVDDDLRSKPEIIEMAIATGYSVSLVIGFVVDLWSHANAHGQDNGDDRLIPRMSEKVLAAILKPEAGLIEAAQGVGWIRFEGCGLVLPGYVAKVGADARRKAQSAVRQARYRIKQTDAGAPAGSVEAQAWRTSDAGVAHAAPPDKTRQKETRKEKTTTTSDAQQAEPNPHECGGGGGGDIPSELREELVVAGVARTRIPQLVAMHHLSEKQVRFALHVAESKTPPPGNPGAFIFAILQKDPSELDGFEMWQPQRQRVDVKSPRERVATLSPEERAQWVEQVDAKMRVPPGADFDWYSRAIESLMNDEA